jgi:hypothetical protein
MNWIPRTTVFLALSVLAGCSVFQSKPEAQECTVAEPASCPVCPNPETLQCPEPQIVEKIVTVTTPAPVITPPPKPTTAGKMNLPIVGAVEWATVEPGDIRMEARIDTGAEFTSVHAEDIQLVEKDGKRWVHFSLINPANDEKVPLEQRLRKKVRIKQSDSEKQTRYVVEMWITVGKIRSLIEVTLSDRDHMEYPLLIGRNMLVDTMIVDVSDRHTVKTSK